MQLNPHERLVFPLDVSTLDEATTWVRALRNHVGVFKVGLELFTAAGPDAVKLVHDSGARCFLDLKLHDISETMARAVASAAALRVEFLTVHCVAGSAALRRCVEVLATTTSALPDGGRAPASPLCLLGVTVLTSLEAVDLAELGWTNDVPSTVLNLARLATRSGVPGLVCSPHEVAVIREHLGDKVVLMVPGVRPDSADHGDQKRVATPQLAIARGADLIVVGRPIRLAPSPTEMATRIVAEIEAGLAARTDATRNVRQGTP
jgi:orotidine-5'-phosphate decarboxylase